MRYSFALLLLAITAGCGRIKPANPAKYFITGVYATFERGKFCVSWDTLIVAHEATQQNLYLVSRASCFQRNLGDEYFPIEPVKSEWDGLYDDASHVISGFDGAPNLQFDPDQNCLAVGGITYVRVQ